MKWFRMYYEARNDAKLRILTDSQHRIWFNLLCFAAEQEEERGVISGYDNDLLAVEVANGDTDLLLETLERLQKLRIVTLENGAITFNNFSKRQYDKASDKPEATRERKRKQRERQKEGVTAEENIFLSHDVTPGHATETDTDTDKETDKETDQRSILTDTSAQCAPEVAEKVAVLVEKSPTSSELIAELTKNYREIEGITEAKGDFSFIGALYNSHGYEQVLSALNSLQMAAATQELKKPLVYLRGILEKQEKQKKNKEPPARKVYTDKRTTEQDEKRRKMLEGLYRN